MGGCAAYCRCRPEFAGAWRQQHFFAVVVAFTAGGQRHVD
jgi:hypothetical protein